MCVRVRVCTCVCACVYVCVTRHTLTAHTVAADRSRSAQCARDRLCRRAAAGCHGVRRVRYTHSRSLHPAGTRARNRFAEDNTIKKKKTVNANALPRHVAL